MADREAQHVELTKDAAEWGGRMLVDDELACVGVAVEALVSDG